MNFQSTYYLHMPKEIPQTMLLSAGVSAIAAIILKQGDPLKMAIVGAFASLVHAFTSTTLSISGFHPRTVAVHNNIPPEIMHCLHTITSIFLTHVILSFTNLPSFNFFKTVVFMSLITSMEHSWFFGTPMFGDEKMPFLIIA